MSEDRIEPGDRVDVMFENIRYEFRCKVLYCPAATGDSWHLEREDGTLVYVQAFSKMVKLPVPPGLPHNL